VRFDACLAMKQQDTVLDERIRLLLGRRPEQGPRSVEVDDVLTTGYARMLELETERGRLERRLHECASLIDDIEIAREVRTLGRRMLAIDGEMDDLRSALAALRTRFTGPTVASEGELP
jgi:hypothetical protein